MGVSLSGNLLVCLASLCLTSLYLTTLCLAVGDDYCSLKCHDGPHTMCQYKQGSLGEGCIDYHKVTVNDGVKKDLLNIHNEVRRDVAVGNMTDLKGVPQPTAADMVQLVWDEELAAVAQRWADQCSYSHDTCRRVRRFEVGQNVAMRTAVSEFTSQDIYSSIDMWVEEVNALDPRIIKKYAASASDHYTQLVWAETGAVGCGVSIYKSGSEEYTQLVVCNYGPSGNMPSRPVYTEGPPCSACPEGTSCSTKYDGLCFSPDYAKKVRSRVRSGGSRTTVPTTALIAGLLLMKIADGILLPSRFS